APDLAAAAKDLGVLISVPDEHYARLVTHLDISADDATKAAAALASLF
ncbi:MAG: hypothetical protein JWO79_4949, partial [Actinomycetia bacterium]|nr:hypothetical protein [Actinomycetes bacterium]